MKKTLKQRGYCAPRHTNTHKRRVWKRIETGERGKVLRIGQWWRAPILPKFYTPTETKRKGKGRRKGRAGAYLVEEKLRAQHEGGEKLAGATGGSRDGAGGEEGGDVERLLRRQTHVEKRHENGRSGHLAALDD